MSELKHKDHAHRIFNKKRLLIAIIITFATLLLEIVGGILSNSLALLSDAAHMFSHLFALSVSYAAIVIACKPANAKKTYGYYRAEILAAFINGVSLFIIVAPILYGAYTRIKNPLDIRSDEMFLIAAIGLVVNIVTALLIKSGSSENLNVKSAFFHALGDMISSVGVVIAAIVIYFTDLYILDTIVSIIIAIIIIYWAISLIRDSVNILLEGTPKDLDLDEVEKSIKDLTPQPTFIHHVHAWQIGTDIYALTAHISIDEPDNKKVTDLTKIIWRMLEERYKIFHTTIQFEYAEKEKINLYHTKVGEEICIAGKND